MRGTTKELVKLTMVLVLVFLAVHYWRGATGVIGSLFRGWGGVIRDFQARGSY